MLFTSLKAIFFVVPLESCCQNVFLLPPPSSPRKTSQHHNSSPHSAPLAEEESGMNENDDDDERGKLCSIMKTWKYWISPNPSLTLIARLLTVVQTTSPKPRSCEHIYRSPAKARRGQFSLTTLSNPFYFVSYLIPRFTIVEYQGNEFNSWGETTKNS